MDEYGRLHPHAPRLNEGDQKGTWVFILLSYKHLQTLLGPLEHSTLVGELRAVQLTLKVVFSQKARDKEFGGPGVFGNLWKLLVLGDPGTATWKRNIRRLGHGEGRCSGEYRIQIATRPRQNKVNRSTRRNQEKQESCKTPWKHSCVFRIFVTPPSNKMGSCKFSLSQAL